VQSKCGRQSGAGSAPAAGALWHHIDLSQTHTREHVEVLAERSISPAGRLCHDGLGQKANRTWCGRLPGSDASASQDRPTIPWVNGCTESLSVRSW